MRPRLALSRMQLRNGQTEFHAWIRSGQHASASVCTVITSRLMAAIQSDLSNTHAVVMMKSTRASNIPDLLECVEVSIYLSADANVS